MESNLLALKELISVVRPGKVRFLDLIGLKNDQAHELYEGLYSGKINSKNEAIEFLFGNKKFGQKYFEKTSRNLKDRLINSLLVLKPESQSTEIQLAYNDCYKKFAAIGVLRGKGKLRSTISIAEDTIKKAQRYGFIDIVLTLSRWLQLHYGPIVGNIQKYEHYTEIIKDYSELQLAEIKAQHYYCEIFTIFSKSRSYPPDLINKAEKYGLELQILLRRHQSFYLILFSYNIMVIHQMLLNDYAPMIQKCQEAINLYEKLPYSPQYVAFFSFQIKMALAYIQLKKFTEAKQTIDQCLKLAPEGTYNWTLSLQYQLMLGIHSNDMQLSSMALEKAKSHPKLFKNIEEQWRIYEAYIILIQSIRKTKEEIDTKFRLNKFLNEVPTFSKDKKGMNINLLILQSMFFLLRKDYNKLIDRADALERYSTRYLRTEETFRINCFIKLLLLLPKYSFDLEKINSQSQKYLNQLSETPLDVVTQPPDLEIVPYEKLWGYVLELL